MKKNKLVFILRQDALDRVRFIKKIILENPESISKHCIETKKDIKNINEYINSIEILRSILFGVNKKITKSMKYSNIQLSEILDCKFFRFKKDESYMVINVPLKENND